MVQQCAASNPACTCSYCTVNFHCPTCARKKDVRAKCCFEAELKAKKEAEMRAREKMEKEREVRARADEIAGQVHEFFSFLLPQREGVMAGPSVTEQGEDLDPRQHPNTEPRCHHGHHGVWRT